MCFFGHQTMAEKLRPEVMRSKATTFCSGTAAALRTGRFRTSIEMSCASFKACFSEHGAAGFDSRMWLTRAASVAMQRAARTSRSRPTVAGNIGGTTNFHKLQGSRQIVSLRARQERGRETDDNRQAFLVPDRM